MLCCCCNKSTRLYCCTFWLCRPQTNWLSLLDRYSQSSNSRLARLIRLWFKKADTHAGSYRHLVPAITDSSMGNRLYPSLTYLGFDQPSPQPLEYEKGPVAPPNPIASSETPRTPTPPDATTPQESSSSLLTTTQPNTVSSDHPFRPRALQGITSDLSRTRSYALQQHILHNHGEREQMDDTKDHTLQPQPTHAQPTQTTSNFIGPITPDNEGFTREQLLTIAHNIRRQALTKTN